MSCSPFDLRDYLLGELRPVDNAAVEQHVAACTACRDELNALNLTRSALLSVPDEEPPRRIAFVSDQVFEPRWWQKIWNSGPQLGFASAAMLSLAIVVHAFVPQPVPLVQQSTLKPVEPPAIVQRTAATVDEAKLLEQVQAMLDQAIAESEDRQTARIKHASDQYRAVLLDVRDYFMMVQKGQAKTRKAAFDASDRGVMQ